MPSVQTSLVLPFLKQDLQMYPWLSSRTRFYYTGANIGEGDYGITYRGYPCDQDGQRLAYGPRSELVIKIPKVQREYLAVDGRSVLTATDEEIHARLNRVRQKSCQDFFHIRKRLLGCKYANPSLDLGLYLWEEGRFELLVTVQPLLEHSQDLHEWLFRMGIRSAKVIRNPDRTIEHNWYGIADRVRWVQVALEVARAIKDIHLRRVTHADIHPGNVFLHLEPTPRVTLIDFGEAFLATPGRNSRPRNANPYLAPERVGPRFLLTESVDVYSFGILLLYLATGKEVLIPADTPASAKRRLVYEEISKTNPSLLGTDEPRILDIIGRSIASDPADRPRMTDICEDLENIQQFLALRGGDVESIQRTSAHHTLRDTLLNLVREIDAPTSHPHNPVLMQLLGGQARQLAAMCHGLKTEMVELSGTRDQLIRSLCQLFECLHRGDSWTAATTLAMWQRHALGSDGSYASANIRALKRGASVRRVFLISVEELGRDFCEHFAEQLKRDGDARLRGLAILLDSAIQEFGTSRGNVAACQIRPKVITWHRERFIKLLDFMDRMVRQWEVPLAPDAPIDIEKSPGLYFGICPVPTLDKVGEIREDNPVSLMYFSRQALQQRWLLVATEAQGRKENTTTFGEPRLLGVRVYQSVQSDEGGVPGIPVDRKAWLQNLINRNSASVAVVLGRLLELAQKTVVALQLKDNGKLAN